MADFAVFALSALLSADDFESFGWRIPFLASRARASGHLHPHEGQQNVGLRGAQEERRRRARCESARRRLQVSLAHCAAPDAVILRPGGALLSHRGVLAQLFDEEPRRAQADRL
jgi:hypothetical protein